MKICPKCSTELEHEVTSCVACGYRMDFPERSAIGKALKWIFVLFNIAMIIWVLVAMGAFDPVDIDTQKQALPHGTERSTGMGVSMIVMIWLICNAVLGVLVWDTRARKRALRESHLQATDED